MRSEAIQRDLKVINRIAELRHCSWGNAFSAWLFEEDPWLPVPGYEGAYSVSMSGQVRSEARTTIRCGQEIEVKGRVMQRPKNHSGYRCVVLTRDREKATRYVHDLVTSAFLGVKPEGQEVRHLNDQPDDNRLENLAYGTRADNMADCVRNGRHHNARKTECWRGHPFDAGNTYRQPGANTRTCRACRRLRAGGRR